MIKTTITVAGRTLRVGDELLYPAGPITYRVIDVSTDTFLRSGWRITLVAVKDAARSLTWPETAGLSADQRLSYTPRHLEEDIKRGALMVL